MTSETETGGPATDRILVVDDEEIIREMLLCYLSEEGYRAETAATGTEAIEMVRDRPYNVVITDIRLPGMSGMEVLKATKAVCAETEVVVMTAFSSEDLAIEAVRLGAYDYLKKPIEDLALFGMLIRQVFEKQKLARENRELLQVLQRSNAELSVANRKLQSMATTDPLTGLVNRRSILARLDEEFNHTSRYGDPFAVMMLDIDHFKTINDTYGHQVGDEVIRHFVDTIRKHLRATDMFGRYGGEEFLLILHHADVAHAEVIAERVRRLVEGSVYRSGHMQIQCTVSIGLAVSPFDSASSGRELLGIADASLYDAKHQGRNRVARAGVCVPA